MCTKDFTRNNLSYFYSATNNTWDSSNQKFKILRSALRKFRDLYNPIYFSHDYTTTVALTLYRLLFYILMRNYVGFLIFKYMYIY